MSSVFTFQGSSNTLHDKLVDNRTVQPISTQKMVKDRVKFSQPINPNSAILEASTRVGSSESVFNLNLHNK